MQLHGAKSATFCFASLLFLTLAYTEATDFLRGQYDRRRDRSENRTAKAARRVTPHVDTKALYIVRELCELTRGGKRRAWPGFAAATGNGLS